MSARARCFVCGARDWRDRETELACGHCGVRAEADYDADACAVALDRMLVPGLATIGPDVPFRMDAYTLRIAASRKPLVAWPAGRDDASALAYPHSRRSARMWLRPRAPTPKRVALAMILHADALDAATERMAQWRDRFAEIVLVADADGPADARDGVRILRHPLDGDFGAQRNRAQGAARCPWVLQLDDDETPSAELLDAMDALTAQCDAQNVVSVGFPRRNLVDGAWSDLWPDVQYRLNRREVRFQGTVHERPAVPGGWRRTTIALDGTIDHRLDRARVEERSQRYEAMRAGAGRRDDEAALLRPFTP